uniref:Ig-like domain-containing protein n=1 Tax=Pygocentrus nattereri TaxID=42514 RepID=A0AAR2K392_PYGNA
MFMLYKRPKAVVSIQPGDQVFIGETVTLTCDIQGGGVSKWQYSWFKDDPNRRVSNEQQYSISSVTESHRGKYTCRGTERGTSRYSHTSDAVTLTVSERPKPAVSIQPDDQVFSGETVTLTCDIQGGGVSNWQYSWFKAGSSTAVSYKQQYSISSVTASDGGTYTCRGTERGTSRYSHTSDAATLTVSGKPTPTVKVDPQSSVYTGDTVTLTCEVESTGWEFLWYKDSQQLQPQSPADKETNTVRVTVSDEGTAEFKCAARRKNYFYDGTRPKATVTIHPADPVFIGETVTLTCDIGSGHHWQYDWVKNSKPLSEAQQRKEYTISKVAASHRGVYTCKGRQSTQPRYSETSDAVTLTVPVSLTVSPSRAQHFSAGSLSLSCEGQSDSTGWRVRRYTHSEKVSDCSSGLGSVTGSTCNISSLSTSHTGVYGCESESGESSNPVNITVTNGSVILDSPVHPVTEGDPLTLRCLYRDPKPSNLTAEFYKNGSLLQTQTTGEMTIRTVSKSDEGLYHCKHPERGESPQSWISVRGEKTISDYLILSAALHC